MARTAEVKRDARIGEADARADSQIKEAIAEEERLAARLANDIEIAKAQRDFELKKAAYDAEVQTKVRSIGWGLGGGRGPLARRSRKPCFQCVLLPNFRSFFHVLGGRGPLMLLAGMV